ncbi:MAG: pyridoxal 5'-phosphate synthase glutaminase subunit PdxT, partial [Planctomycetes bacterium]|nr:pyridoxal 5'-phosphate synthase glutaminase subunit PdxT [Planctomycetota bacterium]
MKIGVLALQGGFAEHLAALADFPEAEGVAIRRRADFTSDVAGLIIPGGESTVLSKLLVDLHLLEPVRAAVQGGLPVFGTFAGLSLLAREVEASAEPRVG